MAINIVLALTVVATVFADCALKLASTRALPLFSIWFYQGAFLYALTAIGWTYLIRAKSLGAVAALYSASTIIALTAIGYFFFGETVSAKQRLGIVAALISIYLVEFEN